VKKHFLMIIMILLISFLYSVDWTIFFYMAADNGLHSYAINDIIEMQKGLFQTNNDIEIIAYLDNISSFNDGKVEILKITPSESENVVSQVIKSYPDENSGNPEVFLSFLDWAYPRYSSTNNALVVWSHSSGWIGKTNEYKWICSDNTSNSVISISDGQFREMFVRHNRKYDIIILDACNAGSFEIFNEVNGYADYIIASPQEMPANGFPWTQILAQWDENYSNQQIAEFISHNFIDAYDFGSVYNPYGYGTYSLTISSVDMSMIDDFIESLNLFANYYADDLNYDNIQQVRKICPEYNDLLIDIDLSWFLNKLLEYEQKSNAPEITINIINDLIDKSELFIVFSESLDLLYNSSISIFFPKDYDRFETLFYRSWSKLNIAKSSWSRFLNYAYGLDDKPPLAVDTYHSEVLLNTLYLDWDEPTDPCEITYSLDLYDNNNNLLESKTTAVSNNNFKIVESGYVNLFVVDESGNISTAKKIDFEYQTTDKSSFYISPNPVTYDKLYIRYFLRNYTSKISIFLYDISGQKVWEYKSFNVQAGEYNIILDKELSKFSSGVYFGVMHTDVDKLFNKFTIIR